MKSATPRARKMAPTARRWPRLSGCPRTLSTDLADMRERVEPKESADATEPAEPIERTEPAEPMEPIEQIEPTEPIERIEPSLATDKIESLEFSDQSAFIRPTYRPPNRVSANVGSRRHAAMFS